MKITLIGSTRFERDFRNWDLNLTLSGHTAYNLAIYPSEMGSKDWYNDEQKLMLDAVHKAKIANSEAVVVINPGGYIGDSTKSELLFAAAMGKSIFVVENIAGLYAGKAENLIVNGWGEIGNEWEG